jgi:hypothetical protein
MVSTATRSVDRLTEQDSICKFTACTWMLVAML